MEGGPPVNQRARIPVRWVGCHRQVCVETVVGPSAIFRWRGGADNNISCQNHMFGSSLIGYQSGMVVRTPTPINQLFNDASIAVHILFLDVYTWN